MGVLFTLRGVCACALVAASIVAPAVAQKSVDELMSHDDLQKIEVKGADLVYARPGATLAAYKRVKIDPVEVAFHKNWKPTRAGSSMKLSAEDRENIRSGVAKIVYDEFARAVQAKGTYQIATEAAPDVLRVRVNIINLYVNAPDTGSVGRSRTYVVSAGEMTIVAELLDSETGQALARMVDRREARSATNQMMLSNSMVNADEARALAAAWAQILRRALDSASTIDGK